MSLPPIIRGVFGRVGTRILKIRALGAEIFKNQIFLCHIFAWPPFRDRVSEVGQCLLQMIHRFLPRTVPQQVVLLDLKLDEHLRLPIIWLIAKTLGDIFSCRQEKKACTLFNTRTTLEASIMLLRKTRYSKAAATLSTLIR